MTNLTKYRVVNADGIASIRNPEGEFNLARLTEAQADLLYRRGSRYIEKVEAPAPKPRKPHKSKTKE